MSPTKPTTAADLARGHFLLHRGSVMCVKRAVKQRTGKHGHARVNFEARDILTGREIREVVPLRMTVTMAEVKMTQYIVHSIGESGHLELERRPEEESVEHGAAGAAGSAGSTEEEEKGAEEEEEEDEVFRSDLRLQHGMVSDMVAEALQELLEDPTVEPVITVLRANGAERVLAVQGLEHGSL